jgi:hypothetical protein
MSVTLPSGLNPQLPPGTVLAPGTNNFTFSGINNANLSPTFQFLLLQQAAANAAITPDITAAFLGIPTGASPFGLSPLLPPGLTSLFPPGINVTLPPPQVNPLFLGVNPLFLGVNPFLAGVPNPLLLSAQLNALTNLNLALRRPVVIVSSRTSLVSPSMLLVGAPGNNSLPVVGSGSLTAGGTSTPGALPVVIALNSVVDLSLEDQKEFQRKINLAKSQTGASSTTVWLAMNLNVLLDDLKGHQDWSGPEVALSEDVLRQINVVPSKGADNADLLRNIPPWPELLQRSAFKEAREQVEALIPELIRQARVGKIHSENLDALDLSLDLMRDQLAEMIRDVPASQYIRAKHFLADLQSGAKAWRRPDATSYFIPMYDPHVKNVGRLVQYMAKNDLRFAPAGAGDEAAYLVLYRAVAVYDLSANLQQTNSGSRVAAK